MRLCWREVAKTTSFIGGLSVDLMSSSAGLQCDILSFVWIRRAPSYLNSSRLLGCVILGYIEPVPVIQVTGALGDECGDCVV